MSKIIVDRSVISASLVTEPEANTLEITIYFVISIECFRSVLSSLLHSSAVSSQSLLFSSKLIDLLGCGCVLAAFALYMHITYQENVCDMVIHDHMFDTRDRNLRTICEICNSHTPVLL